MKAVGRKAQEQPRREEPHNPGERQRAQADDGKMLSGQGKAVRQPRRVDALHVRRVEPIAISEQQGRDDGRSAVPHP